MIYARTSTLQAVLHDSFPLEICEWHGTKGICDLGKGTIATIWPEGGDTHMLKPEEYDRIVVSIVSKTAGRIDQKSFIFDDYFQPVNVVSKKIRSEPEPFVLIRQTAQWYPSYPNTAQMMRDIEEYLNHFINDEDDTDTHEYKPEDIKIGPGVVDVCPECGEEIGREDPVVNGQNLTIVTECECGAKFCTEWKFKSGKQQHKKVAIPTKLVNDKWSEKDLEEPEDHTNDLMEY